MPRRIVRPSDAHPSPFDPNWRDYFRERREYVDRLFDKEDRDPPSWIIDGFLPRGYLVLLAGRPKDGKTCLAMAIAYAVSQGLPFAGMKTEKAIALYFMAEESPEEFDLAIRPFLPEGTISDFGVAFASLSIDTPFDLEALRVFIHEVKPGLIIIDPLLAASIQGDFGNAGRARNALTGLKELCRQLKVTAIVVHHAKERRNRAQRVAENPQLAATASLNIVLNWRPVPKGRILTLDMRGRGLFANRQLKLFSPGPLQYEIRHRDRFPAKTAARTPSTNHLESGAENGPKAPPE